MSAEVTPRGVLFQMAAALAVQEFTRHDTRPADGIAEFCYYPSECEVCGQPTMPQSVYCSLAHERILHGIARLAPRPA